MIITKTTRIERAKNSATLDQFMYSMFDLNIYGVQKVLEDDGNFLGKSKMAFVSNLNSKFIELKDKDICGINVHSGISIDTLPGCDVIEIRFVTNPDLLDENGIFFSKPNDPAQTGEHILRYVLKMKDGKICTIRRTSKFIAVQNYGDEQLSFN